MKKNIKKNKKAKKVQGQRKSRPPQKTTVLVQVQSMPPAVVQPTVQDIVPIQEGGKYMIPKTWLSERQVVKLVQRTPPKYVLKRKGRGGSFDYVPIAYFRRVLNYTFGWNWEFKIVKQETFGIIGKDKWAQVITTGELTVKDDKGHSITKGDNGKADIKYMKDSTIPMDIGNDFKGSVSDCIKRCCVQLGIASDVYGGAEFKEDTGREIVEHQQAPATKVHPTVAPQPVAQKGQIIDPDGNPAWPCVKCGDPISTQTADYSKKMFGKHLCKEHHK